jgi:hypothetical protein
MLEEKNTPSKQNLIAQLQELVKTEQQIGKAIQQKKGNYGGLGKAWG